MTVKEAKTIIHQWAHNEAVHLPGFIGAFYHGSINWLNDTDLLAAASDVDVIVVLNDPQGYLSGKFIYEGLLLEVSYLAADEFRTAEQVLGKFYLAGSFRKHSIIIEKGTHLSTLQQQVAAQYANREWVRKRCEHARDLALRCLEPLAADTPLHDQVTAWLFARGLMVHILLVAGLRNPTVRKRYLEAKLLLEEYRLSEFYERLLESTRFAALGRRDVERHLHALTAAFDDASKVIRTPYRFAADISRTGRPVAIGGSYELIKAGYHREAMFWIVATYCRCQHVLSNDAPMEVRKQHDAGFMELLEALHIAASSERDQSNISARGFIGEVEQVAVQKLLKFL
ncbi:MAG TPA: hypothetical protein VGE90_16185 [Chitinophaga sp.]